ncbi:NTP transferase domain-containing protein [Synechococcus sp. 1G10]|uniref:NTP transferase domain-containing protein n=1 Tax=Synechococcus sp. 1G10 TaxID=2025605 RepID=UPI000B98DBB3|nr:NTP transferase domain-containing protein [Synechococcus sp. 1G10]
MDLIITAAGRGSRFYSQGVLRPKPLIRVHGKELLTWALESFPVGLFSRWLIVSQRKDGVRAAMANRLNQSFPGQRIEWLELDAMLEGQLKTALAAAREGQISGSIVIHNCDTAFEWDHGIIDLNAYGWIPVFKAAGQSWSFVSVNPAEPTRAIDVREKQRISDLASIGLYGFASAERFIKDAEVEISDPGRKVNGEFFIAPMYRQAIQRGLAVHVPLVTGVTLFGTPEQICDSFKISRQQLIEDNQI